MTAAASCMVSGKVAALFSMLARVFAKASMFSSDSTSDARPTRSGRLARNRSKFDCTESMTGYLSDGTACMRRFGSALASRSMYSSPVTPCSESDASVVSEIGVLESMSAMTCTRSAARLSMRMAMTLPTSTPR
jgi:hypothetical protein